MANKKFWLGILVMALVWCMTVVGCDGDNTQTKYDNEATLYVRNNSSIDYYVSSHKWADGSLMSPIELNPDERCVIFVHWNDGESSDKTFYYASDRDSENPLSRTVYNFSDKEKREVTIIP